MSQIDLGGEMCTGASTPGIGVSVGYFQTVAALRAYAGIFTTAVSVYVAGNQASNDLLGGMYSYDPTSTAFDDGYVTINQTVNEAAGRWVLNDVLPVLPNVAALRALPSALTSAGNIFVSGNATPGDGLGGIFTYSTTSTTADNGTSVIQQTASTGPGRWILSSGSLATAVADLEADINAVTEAGDLTPDLGTPGQMLQSLKRVFGGNYVKLSASGALTVDNAGLVVVDCTAGDVILTLPAVATIGQPLEFIVARVDSTGNTLTLTPAGADVYEPGGAATLLVPSGGSAWIKGDGISVWNTIFTAATYMTVAAVTALLAGYAALAGSTTQQFDLAAATIPANGLQLGQISDLGGIGSHLLYESSTNFAAGTTYAGSTIGQSGSWVCLGIVLNTYGGTFYYALFVRVS